jgi:glycosyltransferase involved in cell wall biosynthesis
MPKPAKVLFLVNSLRTGGTERNAALFCRRIDRTRYEPELWTLCGGGEFEQDVVRAGINVRNFERRWSRDPLFAWRMAREISRADADFIHAFLPTIGAYAAFAKSWFGVRKPMILSIGQSESQGFDRWKLRRCGRTFDWFVVNSKSAAELARTMAFPVDRTTIITNGHELSRYEVAIDRQVIRAALGVKAHEQMLVSVGRLIPSKRVVDAIEAVAILAASLPVKLVLVGEGPERAQLEAQVSRLGLSDRVVFAGQRNDVIDVLRSADIFVFPSESEGLPNALIEASLAGLPIVACQVGGVVDVVHHEASAVLTPPRSPGDLAAAIRRLLSDPSFAAGLASAAQGHSRRTYCIEQSLNALYHVYERVLAKSLPPTVVKHATIRKPERPDGPNAQQSLLAGSGRD